MQITAPIIQEISVFWTEIMTTKYEHRQLSLSWSLESFLAWEGYGCEALRGHIFVNFIFSWKRDFLPLIVKILITIKINLSVITSYIKKGVGDSGQELECPRCPQELEFSVYNPHLLAHCS